MSAARITTATHAGVAVVFVLSVAIYFSTRIFPVACVFGPVAR